MALYICLISPVVCPAAAVQIIGRMPWRPRLDWRVYSSRSCAKICSWPENCAVNAWSSHLKSLLMQRSHNTELLIAMGAGVWDKLLLMPYAACTTNKFTVKNGDTWININYLDISWLTSCLPVRHCWIGLWVRPRWSPWREVQAWAMQCWWMPTVPRRVWQWLVVPDFESGLHRAKCVLCDVRGADSQE